MDKKISQLTQQTSLTGTDALVFERSGSAQKIIYDDVVNSLDGAVLPATHSHPISDVTGLQTALDGKAALVHSHIIGDTVGLQTALGGKAATVHSHAINDTTGLVAALAGKSDNGHTHLSVDISDLATTLSTKAAVIHTHVISDVTGLQVALNGKAALSHIHSSSDITDLASYVGGLTLHLTGPVFDPYIMVLKGAGSFQGTIDWYEWNSSRHFSIPKVNADSMFMILQGKQPGDGTAVAGSVPYSAGNAGIEGNMAGVMKMVEGGASVANKYVGWDGTGANLVALSGSGFANPMTTTGDTIYSSDNSGTPARLGVGANGKIIQTSGGLPAYSGFTMPTTVSTAGKMLTSDGTNLIMSTPTFPNASASAGKFIRSDGTNWIASTPTLPTSAGTANKVLLSDGTNYVESTPTFPNASATANKSIISDGTNWVASTATRPDAATTGDIMHATASNVYGNLAAVATGQFLQSKGTSTVPAYSGYTLPTGVPTTGKILISDGTNLIASTPTHPTTATSGKVIAGDGTNWVLSTPTFPTTASATTGKIIQSDGTNWIASTATHPTAATNNKIIVGNGTNYVESTPTFPNASATSGKVIKSDGTNWIASTETYAAPGTSGNVLTSDGTNWTSAAGMTNPMTTAGDIIYGGASGVATRLAATANQLIGFTAAGTAVEGKTPSFMFDSATPSRQLKTWTLPTTGSTSYSVSPTGLGATTQSGTASTLLNANGVSISHAITAATNSAGGEISAAFTVVTRQLLPIMHFRIETGTSIAALRVHVGLVSADLSALSADPTTQHCGVFRYDTGLDTVGQWTTLTCDGASNVTKNTSAGIPIAVSSVYYGAVDMSVSGHVKFWFGTSPTNMTMVFDHSTNLPGNTTTLGWTAKMVTLANVAKTIVTGPITITNN